MSKVEHFNKRRQELNKLVLENADLITKRFFSLDNQAYKEGAIPKKYKELMGLVASLVLRCDDCITYHIIESRKAKATKEEIIEAMSIALIVGGSIVIPHLRRAYETLMELLEDEG